MPDRVIVAQTGGPTAVVNASLAGVLSAAKLHGLSAVGARHGFHGLANNHLVDLTDYDSPLLDRLTQTPGATLGSGRYRVTEADYERFAATLRQNNARYLVLIGGNGTMYVGQRIAQHSGLDVRVMGVPKTMDNDVVHTDHTPGYGSAARFVALAVRDSGLDLEAMSTFDDVVILEVLGRNTGWLAAAAGLTKDSESSAPHLIYVPEINFDEARFLDDVQRIHARQGYVYAVVSEGIHDDSGTPIGTDPHDIDTMGRPVHSLSAGAGAYLTQQVRQHLGLQARLLRPGLIGRSLSACASPLDRDEARQVGHEAVVRLVTGANACMIGLHRQYDNPYACILETIPLDQIGGQEKHLPREYMDISGTMIADSFRTYAQPLTGGFDSIFRLKDA